MPQMYTSIVLVATYPCNSICSLRQFVSHLYYESSYWQVDIINKHFMCHRMLENRGPHMVENDYTPLSALDIFVKDLV